jgi:hypothetical protein
VKECCIHLEDCYLVSKSQQIDTVPTRLSFEKDIWGGGDHAMFVEALKKIPMAEGGRWVWQADKPSRAPNQGRFQPNRG